MCTIKSILCLVWIFLMLRANYGSSSTPEDPVGSSSFKIDVESMTSQTVYEERNFKATAPEEFNSSRNNNVSYTDATFEPTGIPLSHDTLMQIEYYNDIAIRIWRIWSPILLGKVTLKGFCFIIFSELINITKYILFQIENLFHVFASI